MEKSNSKGFTFVELVVVITIISLVSVFGIGSFLDFYKSREFISKINNTQTIIKSEDIKVNNKEIYDYKISFQKDKGYFLINEKIFDEKNIIKIKSENENQIEFTSNQVLEEKIVEYKNELNNLNSKNEISINSKKASLLQLEQSGLSNPSIEKEIQNIEKNIEINKKKINNKNLLVNIYRNGKFIKKQESEDNKIIKIILGNNSNELKENNNYEFKFFLDLEAESQVLNSIFRQKYDLEDNLILKNISDSENKVNLFNKLEIENIGGQKRFYLDGTKGRKAYLFFETNDGKENFLLLKD